MYVISYLQCVELITRKPLSKVQSIIIRVRVLGFRGQFPSIVEQI